MNTYTEMFVPLIYCVIDHTLLQATTDVNHMLLQFIVMNFCLIVYTIILFQFCEQVCEAMPLVIQADQMLKEMNSAQHTDYDADALPLLLLQVLRLI